MEPLQLYNRQSVLCLVALLVVPQTTSAQLPFLQLVEPKIFVAQQPTQVDKLPIQPSTNLTWQIQMCWAIALMVNLVLVNVHQVKLVRMATVAH